MISMAGAERGPGGHARGAGRADLCGLLRVTRVPFPAPSSRRTSQPCACVGSQTTRSGMSQTRTPRVMAPRAVVTQTLSPSAVPASLAVAADIRACTGRAVPARNGSPSCILPVSIS